MGRFQPYQPSAQARQYSIDLTQPFPDTPPSGPGTATRQVGVRLPRGNEALKFANGFGVVVDLIIGLPPNPEGGGQQFPATFDFLTNYGPAPTQGTAFIFPYPGNDWWVCLRSIVVSSGYVNVHKLCYLHKAWPAVSTARGLMPF